MNESHSIGCGCVFCAQRDSERTIMPSEMDKLIELWAHSTKAGPRRLAKMLKRAIEGLKFYNRDSADGIDAACALADIKAMAKGTNNAK
jgi:hypothetical protein